MALKEEWDKEWDELQNEYPEDLIQWIEDVEDTYRIDEDYLDDDDYGGQPYDTRDLMAWARWKEWKEDHGIDTEDVIWDFIVAEKFCREKYGKLDYEEWVNRCRKWLPEQGY